MAWNVRNIRLLRKDKRLKSRQRRSLVSDGASPCPAISLLDLDWSHSNIDGHFMVGVGDSVSIGAWLSESISAGTPPANLSISGPTPTGFSLSYNAPRSVWLIFNDGSAEFGIQEITITGTDALGCPITPRTYEIEVWAAFTNNDLDPILPAAINPYTIKTISVSNLPIPFPNNCLYSVEYNVTFIGVGDLDLLITDPFCGNNYTVISNGILSGNNFTGTIFVQGNTTDITTGIAPYTGNWDNRFQDPAGFNYFVEQCGPVDQNGDWEVTVINNGVGVGTFNSATMIFKPV